MIYILCFCGGILSCMLFKLCVTIGYLAVCQHEDDSRGVKSVDHLISVMETAQLTAQSNIIPIPFFIFKLIYKRLKIFSKLLNEIERSIDYNHQLKTGHISSSETLYKIEKLVKKARKKW